MKQDEKQRMTQVKQAIANERLEGLTVSADAQRIADRYVVGQASAKNAAEKIRERYGIIIQ